MSNTASSMPPNDGAVIHGISGTWSSDSPHVRLNFITDVAADPPTELLLPVERIELLVSVLLQLSSKFPEAATAEMHDTPLWSNSIALATTKDGTLALQFDIGRTRLSFALTDPIGQVLGRALLNAGNRPQHNASHKYAEPTEWED